MKKLLAVAVAAAFAASGFAALAQDKKEVKSAGGAAKAADKSTAVTTGGAKPKRDEKGGIGIKMEHQGKRKTEAQRMEEAKKAKK